MANEEVYGSKFTIDITDLKTGMAEANRLIRVADSSFKAAAAGIGDWSKSADGLSEKIKSLNTIMGIQDQKISALTKEYERVAAEKGKNSREAQELQIKINKETESFNKNERQLKECEDALKDVETGSQKTGKATEEAGRKAEGSGGKFNTFAVTAGTALGNLLASGIKNLIQGVGDLTKKIIDSTTSLAGYADDVNTMAKQYKISTETLQKWSYASKIVDVDLETMGSSLGKLTRAMGNADKGTTDQVDAFKKLGVEYKKSNGTFRDSEDVFYDVIDALGNMQDETEADIIANALFGRSFQDLNPLIAVGSEELKNLGKKAEDLGLVLGQDKLDKLNAFQDSIDTLSSIAKVAAAPFVQGLIPAFKAVTETITNVLGRKDVKDAMETFGKKLGELGTKLTEKFVEFMTKKDDSGKTGFDKLVDGLFTLGEAITDSVEWFFDTALPKLKEVLEWMVNHKEDISGLAILIGSVLTALSIATGNVQMGLAGITLAGAGTIGILDSLKTFINDNSGSIENWSFKNQLAVTDSMSMWDQYFTFMVNTISGIEQMTLGMWDAIRASFSNAALFLTQAWTDFSTAFKNIWNSIGNAFALAWNGIVNGLKGGINTIITGINVFIAGINKLIGGLNKIKLPDFLGGGGVNIPLVGYIPYWAKEGGIFDKASIIGVGEAGPEAVIPISNLSDILIDILRGVLGLNTLNMGGTSGTGGLSENRTVTTPQIIDNRTFNVSVREMTQAQKKILFKEFNEWLGDRV